MWTFWSFQIQPYHCQQDQPSHWHKVFNLLKIVYSVEDQVTLHLLCREMYSKPLKLHAYCNIFLLSRISEVTGSEKQYGRVWELLPSSLTQKIQYPTLPVCQMTFTWFSMQLHCYQSYETLVCDNCVNYPFISTGLIHT